MAAHEREILERAVHAVARMGGNTGPHVPTPLPEFVDLDESENVYPTRSANTTRRSAAENLGLQVVSTSVGLFV